MDVTWSETVLLSFLYCVTVQNVNCTFVANICTCVVTFSSVISQHYTVTGPTMATMRTGRILMISTLQRDSTITKDQ